LLMVRPVCATLHLLCSLPLAALAQQQTATSPEENSLQSFLQDYAGIPASEKDARYVASFVDLNGDGRPEAIVYLTGGGWCGSGGCTTLILTRTASSFAVVTKIPITRLPLRVLTTSSHGWLDITVRVRGGGVTKEYEADLRFDGKTYPSNPSMPPALRLKASIPGRVAIAASQTGALLYP
jgi:hypothetical protein